MKKYDDIIDLPHFSDPKRKKMSIENRAAQFMPFKSLNEFEKYVSDKTDEINSDMDLDYTILYD